MEISLKVSKKEMFSFLVAIVTILNSGYYRIVAEKSYIPLILLILVTILSVKFKENKYNKYSMVTLNYYILLLLIGISLSIFFNLTGNNILSGGRVAVTVICSYFLIRNLNIDKFFKWFTKIIGWIIGLSFFIKLFIEFGYTFMFPTIGRYYDLYIITASTKSDKFLGIFWEPGVFASIIIISYIIELFFIKTLTTTRMMMYILGLFFTQSTAGFIIFAIIISGQIWKKLKLDRNIFGILCFFILCLSLLLFQNEIVILLAKINPDIFGKLLNKMQGTTATRLNSPYINLNLFIQRPICGYGFNTATQKYISFMNTHNNLHVVAQTSTSTEILADIGILGITYSIMFISPIFTKKYNKISLISWLTIVIAMLAIVNKEPHIFIVITWILLCYINMGEKKYENQHRKI